MSPVRHTMITVQLAFDEDGEHTRADAICVLAGRRYHGWGRARRNPSDPDVPAIGEELAAARALADLSRQLLRTGTFDLEEKEGHAVTVHA